MLVELNYHIKDLLEFQMAENYYVDLRRNVEFWKGLFLRCPDLEVFCLPTHVTLKILELALESLPRLPKLNGLKVPNIEADPDEMVKLLERHCRRLDSFSIKISHGVYKVYDKLSHDLKLIATVHDEYVEWPNYLYLTVQSKNFEQDFSQYFQQLKFNQGKFWFVDQHEN